MSRVAHVGDRFSVDVDVAELRRAQLRLASHSGELAAREKQVRRLPEQWAGSWTGGPAETMAGQARALARDTRSFATHFSEAADAVKHFAETAEHAAAMRQGFLDLAAREPARYAVVEAGAPIEDVAAAVRKAVTAAMRAHGLEPDALADGSGKVEPWGTP